MGHFASVTRKGGRGGGGEGVLNACVLVFSWLPLHSAWVPSLWDGVAHTHRVDLPISVN